jgi:serine/threonine protein kinase
MGVYDWQKVKEIFNAAVDLPLNERAGYLDRSCVDDAALRANVENLLANYKSDFLELENIHDPGSEVAGGRLRPSDRLKHYEIIRLLGVGGMGEVYLAKDTLLDRKVAIKLLNEKYESDVSNTRRFVQEAKAASALNHPNILTIHEIGEHEGSHFIVSEFVDGHRLRTVITNEDLDLAKTVNIAIQIAEALAAAHAARIIHRDIKPENIVIRADGYAKVLDFGLAKLLPEPASLIGLEDETVRQNLTAKGLILGTVSYMSPEQAKGEAVDGRTDIFSLGVVLYEMVAGRTPFHANSTSETFANLINRDPAPLSHHTNGVPDELQRIVSKMLRKDPDERYRSMKDLLVDLQDLNEQISGRLNRISSPYDGKESTLKVRPTTDLRYMTAAKSMPFVRWYQRFKPVRGIAAILLVLGVVGTAIFGYLYLRKDQGATNSVQSPAYDLYVRGRVKALRENRDDVEEAIKLLEQAVTIDPNYAASFAALAQAYTTKEFQFAPQSEKKQLSDNAEVAVAKSLSLDPNLAEGYFARGIVLWTHEKRFPHQLAIQSFKHAIELNPNLDEVHQRLAMVYGHIGLLEEAQREIAIQLAINPDNTLARFRAGSFDAYQGRFEDAIEVYKTVPDDVSPAVISRNKADALVHLGRLADASDLVEQYLKTYPNDEGGNVTSVKAILFAKAGKREEAEKTIARAIEIGRGYGHFHHTAYNIASAYAIMNMPDDAIKWLQDAADDGFPCYSYFALDPLLDNLRKDPRFISFMEKGKAQMDAFQREIK